MKKQYAIQYLVNSNMLLVCLLSLIASGVIWSEKSVKPKREIELSESDVSRASVQEAATGCYNKLSNAAMMKCMPRGEDTREFEKNFQRTCELQQGMHVCNCQVKVHCK